MLDEAKAKRDVRTWQAAEDMQTMKTGRVEAIEPRREPTTIGEAIEVLGARIEGCAKGVEVMEQTVLPCIVPTALYGETVKGAQESPSSPLLIQLLNLIERAEGVEFHLRTLCNRVQL